MEIILTIACIFAIVYVIIGIIAALKFRKKWAVLTWPYDLFLLWLVGRYM